MTWFRRTVPRAVILGLVSVLLSAGSASAEERHDDPFDPYASDRQPPFEGPSWTASEGVAAGQVFPSDGIDLMAWFPVTQFSASFTSGSTVHGYLSPSGRKYALIGLSGGTGIVEVTDPAAATIVTTISGPTSTWRDVKTYQNYAYVVNENTGGIQVLNLAQIDSGIVTVVGNVTTGGSQRTHTHEINEASGYLYRCGGGSTLGLRMYSLANPAAPAYIGITASTRYIHECHVVTYTSGVYAGREIGFLCSNNTSSGGSPGLTILDLTNKSSVLTLTANYQYPGGAFSHQCWVTEDRRYVYLNDELDGNPATRIINVENLSAPVQVGTFTNGLAATDHNLYTRGTLIFESNYRSGLRVFDATNPLAPVERAWFDTYPTSNSSNFNGLWDNYPYLGGGIVLGSDIERGLFVWCVGRLGDMNDDLHVNAADVPAFVEALLTGVFSASYCTGPDVSRDGLLDGNDIPGFVAAVMGGP